MSQLHSRLLSGDAYPLSDVILTVSDQIQGITLTDNGKVVLSQFYGRDNDSTLSVYMLNPGEEPDLELNLNGQLIPAFLLDENRLVQSITAIPMSKALQLPQTTRFWYSMSPMPPAMRTANTVPVMSGP